MARKRKELEWSGPELTVRRQPDGTPTLRAHVGPYVTDEPLRPRPKWLPPLRTDEPVPLDDRTARRAKWKIHRRELRRRPYDRTIRALDGRLGLIPAAVMARRGLAGRLRKWADAGHWCDGFGPGAQFLASWISEMVQLLCRVLSEAAGTRTPAADGTGLPPVRALPPHFWLALDLLADLAASVGGLEQAALQARQILAGRAVQEGGRKGGERVRRGPSAEERLGAWRAELDRERRPDGTLPRGAVARIARALARRHGTTPEAERRFAYDHAGELGLPERRRHDGPARL